MSRNSDSPTVLAEEDIQTPSKFVGLQIKRFLNYLVFLTPLIFVVIKAADVQLVGAEAARVLVSHSAFIWPLLEQQFMYIKKVSGQIDANNYVIFIFACLCVYGISAIFILVNILRQLHLISPVEKRDVFLCLVLLFGSLYPIRLDTIKVKPTIFLNFTVDPYGFYYLRQGAMVFLLAMTFLMVATCVSRRFFTEELKP